MELCCLYCSAKSGTSLIETDVRGCLKTEFRGHYLDLKEEKRQKNDECNPVRTITYSSVPQQKTVAVLK